MFPMDFCSLIKIKKRKAEEENGPKKIRRRNPRKRLEYLDDEDEAQPFDNEDVQRDNWMAINIRWINETTPPNFEEALKCFFLNTHLKFKIQASYGFISSILFFIKNLLLDGMNCQ